MKAKHRIMLSVGLPSLLASLPAFGQTYQPSSPEACTAIAADAERLACYDAALRRQSPDTQGADAAAAAASAEIKAKEKVQQDETLTVRERAKRAVDGLFGKDL